MPLAFTRRSSIYSTTAALSYTAVPTYTPAANSLLIAFVGGTLAASPTDPTSVTGHGLTFTKLTLSANLVGATHAISVWVANAGASPSSVACVATWGSNRTGGWIIEFESTGANVSDGAVAAIVQNPTNTGTATNGSVSLVAPANAANRPIAFWCHLANEATTPKVSPTWTENASADGNFNNPPTGVEGEHITGEWDGSPTASWTTSSAWRGVALEVKATITPITGTGSLNLSHGQAGSAALGFLATGALAFALALAGAGTVANPVSGSGNLVYQATLAGSGSQTFGGIGGTSHQLILAGTGGQEFAGSGGAEFGFSLAGSGTVENPTEFAGTGNLGFVAALAGAGEQGFSGSGDLAHVLTMVGTGGQAFAGAGNLTFADLLSGAGTQGGGGSGGLTYPATLSGTGTVVVPIAGSGGLTLAVKFDGAGTQGFSGSGELAYLAGLDGGNIGTNSIVGTGGLAYSVSLFGQQVLVGRTWRPLQKKMRLVRRKD